MFTGDQIASDTDALAPSLSGTADCARVIYCVLMPSGNLALNGERRSVISLRAPDTDFSLLPYVYLK